MVEQGAKVAGQAWSVYMIECSNGSFYTGIATDVERRFRQHANGRGAKYFRRCRPWRLVYVESGHDRSSAGRRERAIKSLSRQNKLGLISDARRLLGEVAAQPTIVA